MKFVITGGGTAGHINPALALAQELRAQGHEVHFAGTPQGLEARLVPQEGFAYTSFKAAGFNRRKPLTIVTSSAQIAVSSAKARTWLKALSPDAVIGFGGYVSIPVGLAASRLKIPLVIHEQNSASGMANRFLAKRARLAALTYESAAVDFKGCEQVVVVGNPVRAALFEAQRDESRSLFDIPAQATLLLVFGGSLGAQHLNSALVAQAERLMLVKDLHVLQITGTRDYREVESMLAHVPQTKGRWHLVDYCDRMGDAYAAADLILSRAGATTLAELSALGKPALLVPYPHAAADEQTTNAASLVELGAAQMIADADLDEPVFMEKLLPLLTDARLREEMRAAARASGSADARQKLARLVLSLVP